MQEHKRLLLLGLIQGQSKITKARGDLTLAIEDNQSFWESSLKQLPEGFELNDVDVVKLNDRVYLIEYDFEEFGVPEVRDVSHYYEVSELEAGYE